MSDEHVLHRGKDTFLLAAGQLTDLLKEKPGFARWAMGPFSPILTQQKIHRDAEGLGKLVELLRPESGGLAFPVRDDPLRNAHALSELDLGEAGLGASFHNALTQVASL